MYLGVDGGGSKTAFILVDSNGHVLARHQEGSLYYPEIGLEATAQVLARGVAATLCAAGLTAESLHFAFIGLPAYGEDSQLLAELDALPGAALPSGRYQCGNDMVCGWAGSLAGQDGISVVAGTGSIAYGQWQQRSARAGGWGELFSDEGSAYWIACQGLNLFSRMSDGRAPRGPLYELVRERLALKHDLDLCAAVYGPGKGQRSDMARFAQWVFEAASHGDSQAEAIYTQAARHLGELVLATRLALAIPAQTKVALSYSGGVFASGDLLLKPFETSLAQSGLAFDLNLPHLSPVMGAVLQAAGCCQQALGEAALDRLRQQDTST